MKIHIIERIKGENSYLYENELLLFYKDYLNKCLKFYSNIPFNKIYLIPIGDIENDTNAFDALYKFNKEIIKNNISNYITLFFFMKKEHFPFIDFCFKLGEKGKTGEIKKRYGHLDFGVIEKVIFNAECIMDMEKNIPLNFFHIDDDKLAVKILKLLSFLEQKFNNNDNIIDFYKKSKSSFYESFLKYYEAEFLKWNENENKYKFNEEYYFCKESSVENDNTNKESSKNIKIIDVAKCADKLKKQLNNEEDSKHAREFEMFSPSLPFLLWELIDSYIQLTELISKDKPLSFLLIDNKIDKFYSDKNNENQGKTNLIKIFKDFKLNEYFSLTILHNKEKKCIVWKKDKFEEIKEGDCQPMQNGEEKKFYFNFKNFINDKDENYRNYVVDKIIEADFVLLDFFLEKLDMYLAYEFIQDINRIKLKRNNPKTIWYIIVSSAFESAFRYSQSGLIAEFYETSIVNIGDDPTNEKRKIIFLYKLLTFVNARLKNFENIENIIKNWLKNKSNEKCNEFEEKKEENKECAHWNNCKIFVENITRKFLLEKDEIKKIFPKKEKEIEKLEVICYLIHNIFHEFEYLTESEWQKIFHQIDLLNNKLKYELNNKLKNESEKNYKFPCKYIIQEIKNRAKRF